MPDRPSLTEAEINEHVLAEVLRDLGLVLYPYTYQGTARHILHDLAKAGYVLLHRGDL